MNKTMLHNLIVHSIKQEPIHDIINAFPDGFLRICRDNGIQPFVLKIFDKCFATTFLNEMAKDVPSINNLENRIIGMKRLLRIFKTEKIEYCISKGMVLSQLLYDDPFFRSGGDIDILVNKEDGDRTIYALQKENVKQVYIEKNVKPYPILLDGNAHEYREFFFEDYPDVFFEIGTSLHNIRGIENHRSFFETKKEVIIKDISINAFDLTHTFLYLCTNIYNDDETKETIRARNYIDLGRFIYLYYNTIDWGFVVQLANQKKVTHCIYYALSNLASIVPMESIVELVKLFAIDSYQCNLDDYFMTKQCALCDWNGDLLERMMQPTKDRIEERQYKLRIRNNSPQYNKNLALAKQLNSFCEATEYTNENYESFYIEKYYMTFQYKMFFENGILRMVFPFEKEIYSFLPRFSINVVLLSASTEKTSKVYRTQTVLKKAEFDWKNTTYKNLFRVFKLNPKRFEEDLLNDEKFVEIHEIPIDSTIYTIVDFNLKRLGFPCHQTHLCYKIWLQEDVVLEKDIHIHQNLLDYSDGKGLYQCKNEVSIDLTYPKAVYLP